MSPISSMKSDSSERVRFKGGDFHSVDTVVCCDVQEEFAKGRSAVRTMAKLPWWNVFSVGSVPQSTLGSLGISHVSP